MSVSVPSVDLTIGGFSSRPPEGSEPQVDLHVPARSCSLEIGVSKSVLAVDCARDVGHMDVESEKCSDAVKDDLLDHDRPPTGLID
ncbi:hypothetical protein V6N11_067636 [Hibiscus sabdariffa]|uniref:Uncharacterized protein n=1 Tax=Hibiscus sabdariffa TaxID=183260 RepID=A0ABR2SS94_9ROSI